MQGLTTAEVQAAREKGEVNEISTRSSRPLSQIIRANIFTVFNAILTAAVVVVLMVGHWPDAVFGIVMVINSATGILAELRAKRTLDSLAMLNRAQIAVRRDGEVQQLAIDQIVLGDTIEVTMGDQIPADCEVLSSDGLELDESMLTGESRPQRKAEGDEALSGASVVAGKGVLRTTAVGDAAYIHRLGAEVKKFSLAKSELSEGINWILLGIARLLPVIVVVLVWSQIRDAGGWDAALASGQWRNAVILAVAGVVGMIPQGLVLLTSVNFATAAMKLARRNVLVQELPAVEILARVNTICIDKTGTLTTGGITWGKLQLLDGVAVGVDNFEDECRAALRALSDDRTNATAIAINDGVGQVPTAPVQDRIPFHSGRKWSAIISQGQTWVMGAPDIIARSATNGEAALELARADVEDGHRVIGLARVDTALDLDDPQLPAATELVGLVTLHEELRSDAAQTLEYFREQGVAVKVISGDNPATVAALGGRLGINDGKPRWIDAATLPEAESPEFGEAILNHDVFGRVTPQQKRAMVTVLQDAGQVVAMTGDGVNDALALKSADLGIAMGSGTAATKAAAKIVLLDGKFATLPTVVAEGRRVLGNMERVASLFLTKTSYALLLAILVSISGIAYPFLPRHLTIISSLTIGIPGFFLALAPSKQRYRQGFLRRTLSLAIPVGVIIGITAYGSFFYFAPAPYAQTVVTLITLVAALIMLGGISKPLLSWRGGLLAAMAVIAAIIVALPVTRSFFALALVPTEVIPVAAGIAAVASLLIVIVTQVWIAKFHPQMSRAKRATQAAVK